MASSELFLLVAGTLTLWLMEGSRRRAVCIQLKYVWNTVQDVLQWKSSTSSQLLQPTTSTPTGLDGN